MRLESCRRQLVRQPRYPRHAGTAAHYREFVGHAAQINLFAPLDGRRKFSGQILSADENAVTIEQDGSEVTLDIDNVVKAKLIPDYEKILTGRKTKQ